MKFKKIIITFDSHNTRVTFRGEEWLGREKTNAISRAKLPEDRHRDLRPGTKEDILELKYRRNFNTGKNPLVKAFRDAFFTVCMTLRKFFFFCYRTFFCQIFFLGLFSVSFFEDFFLEDFDESNFFLKNFSGNFPESFSVECFLEFRIFLGIFFREIFL